ncbi:hypothetical protein J4423_02825 [Candidatus Pacearchaeota archaeon]|nr:hypothetical protein [Candidatus Pacearchaeota archaeon]
MTSDKSKIKREVKTFLLEVPTDIWEKWKDKIPRSISINKALIDLLKVESEK